MLCQTYRWAGVGSPPDDEPPAGPISPGTLAGQRYYAAKMIIPTTPTGQDSKDDSNASSLSRLRNHAAHRPGGAGKAAWAI